MCVGVCSKSEATKIAVEKRGGKVPGIFFFGPLKGQKKALRQKSRRQRFFFPDLSIISYYALLWNYAYIKIGVNLHRQKSQRQRFFLDLSSGAGERSAETAQPPCNHVCRREMLGFRVQGSGFRVQGSGFRVQGLGFRV